MKLFFVGFALILIQANIPNQDLMFAYPVDIHAMMKNTWAQEPAMPVECR